MHEKIYARDLKETKGESTARQIKGRWEKYIDHHMVLLLEVSWKQSILCVVAVLFLDR